MMKGIVQNETINRDYKQSLNGHHSSVLFIAQTHAGCNYFLKNWRNFYLHSNKSGKITLYPLKADAMTICLVVTSDQQVVALSRQDVEVNLTHISAADKQPGSGPVVVARFLGIWQDNTSF